MTGRRLTRTLLLLLAGTAALDAQRFSTPSVFATPINAARGASTSSAVNSIGQVQHLIRVESVCTDGTQTVVSGIQVRIEASYGPTCALTDFWFPISADITATFSLLVGSTAYAFEKAYGVFPCVRVHSISASNETCAVDGLTVPLTVRYFGHIAPVVPTATKKSDRYVF